MRGEEGEKNAVNSVHLVPCSARTSPGPRLLWGMSNCIGPKCTQVFLNNVISCKRIAFSNGKSNVGIKKNAESQSAYVTG